MAAPHATTTKQFSSCFLNALQQKPCAFAQGEGALSLGLRVSWRLAVSAACVAFGWPSLGHHVVLCRQHRVGYVDQGLEPGACSVLRSSLLWFSTQGAPLHIRSWYPVNRPGCALPREKAAVGASVCCEPRGWRRFLRQGSGGRAASGCTCQGSGGGWNINQ